LTKDLNALRQELQDAEERWLAISES